jgi:creatinine amidohydrolase
VERLSDRTWQEIGDGPPPILLVPLGSTEQHGPHLPLGTDTYVAEALARALAQARADLVLGPTIPVGASGEHAGFPGLLSIGTEQLAAFLTELVRSARSWVRGLVLVSGHGGNAEALGGVVARAGDEGDLVAVVGAGSPGADAHAGRAETSLLLALEPSLVRETGAVRGLTTPIDELLEELRTRGVAPLSPSGVLGDPAGATAEEGRARLASMREAGLRRIEAVFGP